jgi:RNA polymerase sigma factor (sigma-70 family)
MPKTDLELLTKKIYKYCVKITCNKWDAEDLSQDVLIKVFKTVENNPEKVISNAFLYRIALNTWKDECKKNKNQVSMVDEGLLERGEQDPQLVTHELLEVLAHRLSPRAMVIILLMDVFGFTAKETAELMLATEGSVQVTIGRVRKRLKMLAQQMAADPMMIETSKVNDRYDGVAQLNFSSLVNAFKKRDPKAICRSYLGLAKQKISIRQIQIVNGKLFFSFTDMDGNKFQVSSEFQ